VSNVRRQADTGRGRVALRLAVVVAAVAALGCRREATAPVEVEVVDELIAASPAEADMDGVRLGRLVDDIRTGRYRDIHSLLIVRYGRVVVQEYFNEGAADRVHTLQSVTKSVASALIGIAIEAGALSGVDERVVDFFPQWRDELVQDERRARQTVEDILTMRTGTDYVEGFTASPHDSLNALATGWDRFWLERPMPREPGTYFQYDSGGVIALSSILQARTGDHADAYAAEHLFGPLGITEASWYRNQEGHPHTGGGLFLRSIDVAKFGQLFLQRGRWGDRQIVPESWVDASFRTHVTFSPPAGRYTGYGYLWWILPDPHSGHEPMRAARGALGQHIFVVPAHQLVVVVTAGARNGADMNRPTEFLYTDILTAMTR
jgi:CubicO group peptidase (beta-lactamase class C family)